MTIVTIIFVRVVVCAHKIVIIFRKFGALCHLNFAIRNELDLDWLSGLELNLFGLVGGHLF